MTPGLHAALASLLPLASPPVEANGRITVYVSRDARMPWQDLAALGLSSTGNGTDARGRYYVFQRVQEDLP